jgi:CheY-like chemotaxis protein
MFAVSDTGAGMSHDVKAHLFEPFFTTKAVGQGTGMGLATVYGIVQQSGGHISVYSNEGVGSTFKVFLPESETGKPAEQPAKAEPPKPGSETILLVEDEEGVRESAAEYLARLGYRVITAIDGEQAVALAAAQNGPIHLLLTDIVMPHMSGRDVANQLHTAHPEIAVLFISGYTDNMLSNYIAPGEQINFLQKPFSLRQLAMKVREVLEQRPTPAGSAR